uniref:Calcium and integrin binding family member 1 n=1 Tax=Gallus gallus TaxID=9031 RepID=A0A8V0X4C5_CHICK
MGGSSSLLPQEALGEYQELTFLNKQEILLAAPAPGLPRALPHGGAVVFASSSAYKRFSELLPREQRENACSVRVPKSQILTLPELRVRYLEWGGWAGSPAEPSPCSPWIASSAPCRAPPCDGTAVPGGMGRDQSGALLLVGRCQPCPQPSPSRQANPFQHRICHVFSTSEDGDDSMSFEDFLDMLSVFSDAATSDIKSRYAFRIFDFDDDGVLDGKDLEKLVNCLTGQGEEARLSSIEMEQLIRNVLEESDIDKDGTINLSEFQHVISRSPDFVSSFKIVL